MTVPILFDPKRTTLRDLDRIAAERGRRGTVAVAEKGKGRVAPWRESSLRGSGLNKRWSKAHQQETEPSAAMVSQMLDGLPPTIRRTPRERYRVLIERLVADALESKKRNGYIVWPRSVQQELYTLGWKDGDPNLWGQIEALARKMIEEGANKQRAKDDKQITTGWHGHYSA